jgi:hypothetical protein
LAGRVHLGPCAVDGVAGQQVRGGQAIAWVAVIGLGLV